MIPVWKGGAKLSMNTDDFTAKLMNDMDPALLDFVKNKVNTFIKWDLVRFFHENPNTADSVENIAKYAGRNAVAVKPELEELVAAGVMEKRLIGDIPVYRLVDTAAMRQLIDNFIVACDDRHFRVKAVYHIIRGMR
jgi:hypothetical protein